MGQAFSIPDNPMTDETIWILTDDPLPVAPPEAKRGDDSVRTIYPPAPPAYPPAPPAYLPTPPTTTTGGKGVQVSVDKLEREMSNFLRIVGRLFQQAERQSVAPEQAAGMQLDEIELSVEISASGEVKLIGSGVKADGKGAITLTFKRAEPKPQS